MKNPFTPILLFVVLYLSAHIYLTPKPAEPGFFDCKSEREQIFECLGNLAECRMEAGK